jgi:hypothetical protein
VQSSEHLDELIRLFGREMVKLPAGHEAFHDPESNSVERLALIAGM